MNGMEESGYPSSQIDAHHLEPSNEYEGGGGISITAFALEQGCLLKQVSRVQTRWAVV